MDELLTEGNAETAPGSAGDAVVAAGVAEAAAPRESGKDQREDERFEVEGDAELKLSGMQAVALMLRGRILNISSSGCYVQTIAWRKLPPGTEVALTMSIGGVQIVAKAESRFSRSKVGMGFRFLEMSPDNRVKFDRQLNIAQAKTMS